MAAATDGQGVSRVEVGVDGVLLGYGGKPLSRCQRAFYRPAKLDGGRARLPLGDGCRLQHGGGCQHAVGGQYLGRCYGRGTASAVRHAGPQIQPRRLHGRPSPSMRSPLPRCQVRQNLHHRRHPQATDTTQPPATATTKPPVRRREWGYTGPLGRGSSPILSSLARGKEGTRPMGRLPSRVNRSTADRMRASWPTTLAVRAMTLSFSCRPSLLGGQPNQVSAWVYGDGSKHYLNAWVKDAKGETWQFTFGQVKHSGWQQMVAWLDAGAGGRRGTSTGHRMGQLTIR